MLGHPHTARHCRRFTWSSRYFGRNEPLSTSSEPDRDLATRIDEDLRRRLAAPPPDPLPFEVDQSIDAILARYR